MEFLAELIMELFGELLGIPLEKAYDRTQIIRKRWVKIVLRIIIIILALAILFGGCMLISYLFRGYLI